MFSHEKGACQNDMERFFAHSLVLLDGPVQSALFCLMVRNRMLCFASLSATERFVLLNEPVQYALFRLMVRCRKLCFALWSSTECFVFVMDRYRNVCFRFMARNCRFQIVSTHGCQHGNHSLQLRGTAGSQRLILLVPTLEPWVTIASDCRFQRLELR